MRPLRDLLPGRGRRQPHVLRALRAPAPRPGVGGHRGERRQQDEHGQGDGAGVPGLRPGGARQPPRPHRHRPHALQHHRQHPAPQRAADAVQAPHDRTVPAGAQRQPRQRGRAARGAARPGGAVRDDERHRGARPAAGAHAGRDVRPGARRRPAARRGRVLPAVPDARLDGGRARPAGDPADGAGTLRRRRRARRHRLRDHQRDVRAGRRGRVVRARRRARRDRDSRCLRDAQHQDPPHRTPSARCAPSSSSTSRGRTA